MFAVIKAGGKQYRVIEDQVLKVEGVKGEPGTIVQLGDVIMLGGDKPEIGAPMVSGASVAAEILDHVRGAKVIAFKKRRRKNSRRKRGHRQEFTLLRITEILTDGAKPTKTARPKHVRQPKPAETTDAMADDGDDTASSAPKAKAKGKKPAAKKPAKAKPAAKGKSKKK
jgi:large subunit ribosomal protein L21